MEGRQILESNRDNFPMKVKTIMKRFALTILVCAAFTPAVSAQQINIEFGSTFGTPSDSFGAGSGQAGVWNTLLGASWQTPLVDINGNETNAEFTDAFGTFEFAYDNPETTGDDESLIDDFLDLGFQDSAPRYFTVTGLNPGTYTVYSYNMAPDNETFITGVWVNDEDLEWVGGAWGGDYTDTVTHAIFEVTLAAGEDLVIHTEVIYGYGSFAGLQIIPHVNPCPADLTANGTVGPADLAILLGTWGPAGPGAAADLDGDGMVGPADLAVLLGNWGPCV